MIAWNWAEIVFGFRLENMADKEYTKSRFIDLSRMAYEKGVYTFSDFLTLAELSDLYECTGQLYGNFVVFGGYDGAERCMVRFGSEDMGYEIDFPISVVRIEPLQKKFAEQLGHRDYLGSLMKLGIERGKLGDIVIREDTAYVFVDETLAPLVCDELTRVRHTSVKTDIITNIGQLPQPELKEAVIQIKAERIDAVVAKVFNLSRSQAAELFAEKKVFCDGRLMENESHKLKENVIVSVRGCGRFIFCGIGGTSKKGNLYATVKKYV